MAATASTAASIIDIPGGDESAAQTAPRGRLRSGPLVVGLILMGPILAMASYAIINSGNDNGLTRALLFVINLAYALALVAMIAMHLLSMVLARRRRSAGSQLHLRLTGMFALIAFLPTVIVAIFATLMVNFGIERWFSDRVGSVVRNALVTAEAYEREHLGNLVRNAELMRSELDQAVAFLSPDEMQDYVREQSIHRNLDEAFIISSDRQILARGEFSYLFNFERPTDEQLERARAGEMVVIDDNDNGEIRALTRLARFDDAFLYITRDVQGEVLRLLDETRETVQLYEQLEEERDPLLINYALQYLGLALLIIMAAILLGVWFAERLARPVIRLAGAADEIGRGNLDMRVPVAKQHDEISLLSRAFNRMTERVKNQRDALIRTRDETEKRRFFIEAVLSGVSAGVVGLDGKGRVELLNEAGGELLSTPVEDLLGQPFTESFPAFGELIDQALQSPTSGARGEVKLAVRGHPREFLARIVAKSPDDPGQGLVLTFDDITALAAAQRQAAWGDVARRIAHEIKNPLTPIQLSADRIRRKYAKLLGDEADSFTRSVEVITRQTADIRRMVDEFVKFARLPEPVMSEENLARLIGDAVTLQRDGNTGIAYGFECVGDDLPISCDRGLINQVLVNLLQNAADAIEARSEKEDGHQGRILVRVEEGARNYRIRIIDNGAGLPQEGRDRLTDPYVTNRKKGTGLGLAIVTKIMEQHGGDLVMSDAETDGPDGTGLDGAEVTLRLPRANFRNPASDPKDGAAPEPESDLNRREQNHG